MQKYFKDKVTQTFKLSEYLKFDKTQFKYYLCAEQKRQIRTEYIMQIIGDAELDQETYSLFIAQFQRFGGRYDVRTKKETIKGMYELSQKYPYLSTHALEEIWSVYIHDQFEEYDLAEELGNYFELYGKTDKSFDLYLEYVDEVAKEQDKQFHKDVARLIELCEDYDQDLIEYLQTIIKRQHVSLEDIISSLPSKELIVKDKKQLCEIIQQTRIFFGTCYPISYQMISGIATGDGIEHCPEQPQYVIYGTTKIDATFTKQEFLDSIKERKETLGTQKVLKRKGE